jgi:hypothetical protein
MVWLAQQASPELRAAAEAAAAAVGLPLRIVDVGTTGLERSLEPLCT